MSSRQISLAKVLRYLTTNIIYPRKKSFRRAISLCLLTSLACASFPAAWAKKKSPQLPPPPPVNTPAQWSEAPPPNVQPIAGTQILPVFPDSKWWEQYHDPLLNQYIEKALKANQNLEIAQLKIGEAKQLANVVRAQELPTVTLGAEAERDRLSKNIVVNSATTLSSGVKPSPGQPYNYYNIPLTVNYEADIFRKHHLQTLAAKTYTQSLVQDSRAVALSLTSAVASTYFNLVLTDKLIENDQNLLTIINKDIALQKLLFKQGVISYDNVLVQEEALAQTTTNLAQFQQSQSLFAHQLGVLVGEYPQSQDKLKRADLDNMQFPTELPTGTTTALIHRRPDILENELLLSQANINVKVAQRDFLPTISLSGMFGFAAINLFRLFDWESYMTEIGASVLQDLYTGGAKTATLKVQKVRAQEQVHQYKQTILTAFQEVEDSLSSLRTDYAQYQQALTEVNTSTKDLELVQHRYQNGINTLVDVLLAHQQLLTFEQTAIQYKANCLVDTISLYKAMGGGF